ncbi:hypothetical protein DENIS_0849 [Desulfonema ishimotonii]|uniref:Uncharacterized protein n=1 Tax=Desulfonema ishimotonii TaxID=45657 RepID=A0A401FSG7_9BACT|nr:hypothetical protein [Desulfonema ishimotonii]GBC59907.1 hypothetical protein DENIS_0849 [Desulfonema ishimotonii]
MQENAIKVNNTRLVVSALLTGAALKSGDIARMASEALGTEVKTRSISGILSRISDREKCDLGFFIRKSRQGNTLVYSLVREALDLSENHAYGLTRKIGKDRYSLAQATRDFPRLRKYAATDNSAPRQAIRVIRKLVSAAGPQKVIAMNSAQDDPSADRKVEVSVRYSSRYAVSLTTTFSTFVFICCALVLTLAACSFLAYAFFYHLLIIASVVAGVCFAGIFFWRARSRVREKT